ncbi:MAG: tRNA lysidine(34) synthetase TilS [Thermodesulfobacteriota bacterium]|nr:tRNA lysidine(34) synthetase TilS [Thermodesulfobacteriota bacterium]
MGEQSNALCQIVIQTIAVHRMLQSGDAVLIGVSGGPDSVALLHLLMEIGPDFNLTLAIVHLNHDLRGAASDRDADFVAALAQRLNLALFSERRDVLCYRRRHRLSVETAARHVRYAFFSEIMEAHGFNKIALGHHMNDNAELVLMNLFRGSGPTGLSGIPPVRDNKIIRPLIDLTRRQIMDYLIREEHDYVIDASNADRRYLRNRIRSELLPTLAAEYNRGLVYSLNKMAAVFRSEDRWIEQTLAPIFDTCLIERTRNKIIFSIPAMADLDPAIQRRLFRRAIKLLAGDLRRISFGNIEAVLALLAAGQSWKSIDLPHRIRVSRTDKALAFSREKGSLRHIAPEGSPGTKPLFTYHFTPPGELIIDEADLRLVFSIIDTGEFPLEFHAADSAAYLDLEKLTFPVIIRNWKAGDRFSPLGLGGTQSVRKFLAGREKDHRRRSLCPVMISEDRIVWVIGYRIANGAKIGPGTRHALKVQVLLAKR